MLKSQQLYISLYGIIWLFHKIYSESTETVPSAMKCGLIADPYIYINLTNPNPSGHWLYYL